MKNDAPSEKENHHLFTIVNQLHRVSPRRSGKSELLEQLLANKTNVEFDAIYPKQPPASNYHELRTTNHADKNLQHPTHNEEETKPMPSQDIPTFSNN